MKKGLIISVLCLSMLVSCNNDGTSLSNSTTTTTTQTNTTTTTTNTTTTTTTSELVLTKTLKLTGSSNMEVNQEVTLSVEYDENADVNLVFSSSDEEILTVDSNGLVKALSVGMATISVKDLNSQLSDSLEITVGEAFEGFKTVQELKSYIYETSAKAEETVGKITVKEKTDGSWARDYTTTVYHYDNDVLYVEEDNQGEIEKQIKQIKDNTFYDVSLFANGGGYVLKHQISDMPIGDEISIDDAKEEVSSNREFISAASELPTPSKDSMRETVFDISSVSLGDTIKVTGQGHYLFKWASGTAADYETYSLEMEMTKTGVINKFSYTTLVYTDDSYDVKNDVLKDDATVEETSTYELTVENNTLLDGSEFSLNVDDYFTSEIKAANYNKTNTLKVGDSIASYNIEVTEYAPSTALDYDEFTIVSVTNAPGTLVFEYDEIWGEYEAIAPGTATLRIANRNTPSVTFDITLTVNEEEV